MELGEYQAAMDARLKDWEENDFSRRLREKDHTLWANSSEGITDRLGWLFLPENMRQHLDDMTSFAEEVKKDGINHVVLLGMGGSSLAPEVYRRTFGNAPGYPELIVLDSTHPRAVQAVEDGIDLKKTLFIVASKSGGTLETLSFFRYFWDKISSITDEPGRHFIAITDIGTSLEDMASERGFRKVFNADPDVGGRYAALTHFGLVPAALIGRDVRRLLDRAQGAQEYLTMPETRDPALTLGAALGELALAGRDKVTFLASESVKAFPLWLEQLIAESTGKNGKGILPVVDEPPTGPYGGDRVFVYFQMAKDDNSEMDEKFKQIQEAGHPTIQISLKDTSDIGQEIFRWEVAVASAGSVLGIQPFDQPDVELAKQLARDVMSGKQDLGGVETLDPEDAAIKDLLASTKKRDYVSIHAYLRPTAENTEGLQAMRKVVLDSLGTATTMGYGPSFLHSTGQLYKGGPNTGVSIQLVDESTKDLAIPETDYSFGALIRAQAMGDYLAMKEKGRRVVRVNLKGDVEGGLKRLIGIIREV